MLPPTVGLERQWFQKSFWNFACNFIMATDWMIHWLIDRQIEILYLSWRKLKNRNIHKSWTLPYSIEGQKCLSNPIPSRGEMSSQHFMSNNYKEVGIQCLYLVGLMSLVYNITKLQIAKWSNILKTQQDIFSAHWQPRALSSKSEVYLKSQSFIRCIIYQVSLWNIHYLNTIAYHQSPNIFQISEITDKCHSSVFWVCRCLKTWKQIRGYSFHL